jgi:prophage DNA circulation protein
LSALPSDHEEQNLDRSMVRLARMNIKTRNERIEDLESTVQVLSEKVSSLERLSMVSADVLANLGHLLNCQIGKSNELSNLLFALISLVAARTGLSASDVVQELKGIACESQTPTATSTAIFSFLQGFEPLVRQGKGPAPSAEAPSSWLLGVFQNGEFGPQRPKEEDQ